jgi:hypothetical protein
MNQVDLELGEKILFEVNRKVSAGQKVESHACGGFRSYDTCMALKFGLHQKDINLKGSSFKPQRQVVIADSLF